MIDVAAKMIADNGSQVFHITDLAELANVGVPTVYYHFHSRSQIIAEAQMANYFAMTVSLHRLLSKAETALSTKNEDVFWEAIQENLVMAWSAGAHGDKMEIVKLLLDVWSDDQVRDRFRERLDIQFARWTAVVNDAKNLGWVVEDLDAKSLVSVFWSASVGQVITSGSQYVNVSPEDIAKFCMRIFRNFGTDSTP